MNRRNVFAALAVFSLLGSPALAAAATEYTPYDDTKYPAAVEAAASPSAPASHDRYMAYDDMAYPTSTPEPRRQAAPAAAAPSAPMLACDCSGR